MNLIFYINIDASTNTTLRSATDTTQVCQAINTALQIIAQDDTPRGYRTVWRGPGNTYSVKVSGSDIPAPDLMAGFDRQGIKFFEPLPVV